jgi:hypothetical protein
MNFLHYCQLATRLLLLFDTRRHIITLCTWKGSRYPNIHTRTQYFSGAITAVTNTFSGAAKVNHSVLTAVAYGGRLDLSSLDARTGTTMPSIDPVGSAAKRCTFPDTFFPARECLVMDDP